MTDDDLTEKQKRVVDAAMEVFAEKGFAGASTAEIAKRAGVAEGTVFKNYKTKKDLLIGVVAPLFARTVAPVLLGEVKAIINGEYPHFEDQVRALYQNRIAFIRGKERIVRVALQEVPFHDEIREFAKKTVMDQLFPDAVAMVKKWQALGEIRQAEPRDILRVCAGTFFSYVVTAILLAPESKWDDADEIELMVSVVAKGLRP